MISDYPQLERVGRLLESSKYTFAKTLAKTNPHHYTLREVWEDPEDFFQAVQFIRDQGYEYQFWGKSYTQLDVNDHYYWSMGAPVRETTLINRKPKEFPTGYSFNLAKDYDRLYTSRECLQENSKIFEIIGDVSDKSVLDVGCGTGLFLDYANPGKYIGIDPSRAMLDRFIEKGALNKGGQNYRVLQAYLRSFVGGRYDLVVALFGSANYLNKSELERIPTLLNPGGRAIVMIGDVDYYPKLHDRYTITSHYNHWKAKGQEHIGHYQVLEIPYGSQFTLEG